MPTIGSRYVVEQARGYLSRRGEGPVFLFLHTYEVHHPYSPDAADVEPFRDGYVGPLPDLVTVELLRAINDKKRPVDDRDRRHVESLYDAEIRSMDRAFGVLVALLKERGLYDPAVIVVTSDHGEEFGEHGRMGWHSHTLFEELLRVPLLVKLPGSARAGIGGRGGGSRHRRRSHRAAGARGGRPRGLRRPRPVRGGASSRGGLGDLQRPRREGAARADLDPDPRVEARTVEALRPRARPGRGPRRLGARGRGGPAAGLAEGRAEALPAPARAARPRRRTPTSRSGCVRSGIWSRGSALGLGRERCSRSGRRGARSSRSQASEYVVARSL